MELLGYFFIVIGMIMMSLGFILILVNQAIDIMDQHNNFMSAPILTTKLNSD